MKISHDTTYNTCVNGARARHHVCTCVHARFRAAEFVELRERFSLDASKYPMIFQRRSRFVIQREYESVKFSRIRLQARYSDTTICRVDNQSGELLEIRFRAMTLYALSRGTQSACSSYFLSRTLCISMELIYRVEYIASCLSRETVIIKYSAKGTTIGTLAYYH